MQFRLASIEAEALTNLTAIKQIPADFAAQSFSQKFAKFAAPGSRRHRT
jgi:hypothetical protein